MKSCEFWAKFWQCLSTGMWTESVWCDFPEKKVSKLHPIRQIWQCYLTNFSGWIIREFAVLTMAAATARAGLRTPMALYRYSFGLHLIWNRDFKPFGKPFWKEFVMEKCWPRSCLQDFQSFSVKWPCYSQLDSMKQFCFDEFFLSRNSNKPRIQIFWKNTADWWQILSFYNNCGAFVA